MGAWGIGIFDDDIAYDFADEIAGDAVLFFSHSFNVAIASARVGVDESHAVAVSAAYVDAIVNGTAYRHDNQADFDSFVARNRAMPVGKLRPLAVQALERVLSASDLDDEWGSATPKDYAARRGVLREIQARLAGR